VRVVISGTKPAVVVSDDERAQVQRWARRAKTAQYLALRAEIVLRAAEGGTDKQVAVDLAVDASTVQRWRARFTEHRLNGLQDEPRSGRPPSISLDQVEDVIITTLESSLGADAHRSRASMAQRSGLPKSTIGRIWRNFGLKPHLQDTFKLSTDPQFVEKSSMSSGSTTTRRRRPSCCAWTRGPRLGTGAVPTGVADDARHARTVHARLLPPRVTNLFAAFNIADGTVIGQLHPRHRPSSSACS
jgi:transposase